MRVEFSYKPMTIRFQRILGLLCIGIPFLIYLLHASYLKGWIVDDAGISFVYARNLALGHGLVSQPGVFPVEGYSNFIWVLVLAPFFALHLFDPILTPKIISAIMVLGTFLILAKIFQKLSNHAWIASLVVLSLLAINTPFVVWTSSGLENPLYCLELASLLLIVCLSIENRGFPVINALAIGIVFGLVALTRPEGLLYSLLIPIIIILILYGKKDIYTITWVNRTLITGSSFCVIFISYLLFRRIYFGDFFPNPYYAKGGPTLDSIKSILLLYPEAYSRLAELNSSFANRYGYVLFALVIIAWLGLIFRGQVKKGHLALLSFYGMAVFAFLLLPRDWMKEFRYATPVILFFYPCLYLAGELWLTSIKIPKLTRLAIGILSVFLFFVSSAYIFYHRTLSFVSSPTVPFSNVVNDLGLPFNRAADKMGIKNGSLLIPDVGGTLYVSNLRIYDLGMLCDSTIARTMGKDQVAFYNYLFEIAKPTFIHTHFPWDLLANLDADPRFRRDYVAIREAVDPQANVLSGDYVRKDVLSGKENLLPTLLSPQ